jgi:hypothetical protein
LGFGGYYSICAPASRGPALGAIPDPIEGQTAVHVTEMLYHPHDAPQHGTATTSMPTAGSGTISPPEPSKELWSYDDWCRAGTFVETEAGHAYVALSVWARAGWDTTSEPSPARARRSPGTATIRTDLGAAARGQKPPWQVAPVPMTRVQYPLGRTVTGACFDARSGRLYLCLSWAYPDGRESFPVVHVYAELDREKNVVSPQK